MLLKKMRSLLFACALLASFVLSGCAPYSNDRAYISEEQYLQARTHYRKTQSLLLTERYLEQQAWRRPQINEALYRLKKTIHSPSDRPDTFYPEREREKENTL